MTIEQPSLFSSGEPDPVALAIRTLRRAGWEVGPRQWSAYWQEWMWVCTEPETIKTRKLGHRSRVQKTDAGLIATAERIRREREARR